ncbi:MAG: polyhydroxyalkanoate granule-associated phasin, partial [Luteimonas sp.]
MTRKTQRQATRLGQEMTEMMIAAPQVVAHRTTRMLTAGHTPNARDSREFKAMGDEKLAAFSESWQAMASQAMTSQMQLVTTLTQMAFKQSNMWWSPFGASRGLSTEDMTQLSHQMQSAALQIASKGMAPVRKRAVANA